MVGYYFHNHSDRSHIADIYFDKLTSISKKIIFKNIRIFKRNGQPIKDSVRPARRGNARQFDGLMEIEFAKTYVAKSKYVNVSKRENHPDFHI